MSAKLDIAGQMILDDVLAMMQRAGEIGGPEGDSYDVLMERIAEEATRRRTAFIEFRDGDPPPQKETRTMDHVIAEFKASLEKMIGENFDDAHDLASWVCALDEVRARYRRRLDAMMLDDVARAFNAADAAKRAPAARIVVSVKQEE